MTADSAYMVEVEVLRTGLYMDYPTLKESMDSPVQSRLLARLNHVIDDDKAAEFLESLPEDVAALRTAMPAGGTHLDAIGTSKDELLSNDVWSALTRKAFGTPLLPSCYNPMESGLGHKENYHGGNHSVFCDSGTWGVTTRSSDTL